MDPRPPPPALDLAVVGAGPVGLGLALHAARQLPEARITLYDARPLDADVSRDPRVLALSLGSVQWLARLGAWNEAAAQPIGAVHVSQAPPSGLPFALPLPLPGTGEGGEPSLCIRAEEEGVPMLGAVLSYGQIVAPLQAAWLAAVGREPERLVSRFGLPVAGLKNEAGGVEVDAGICERHALAVVAEGGVYAGATHRALAAAKRPAVARDYGQTAWVGQLAVEGGDPATAFERFTRHGPVALLPLKPYEDAPAYVAGPAAASSAPGRHGATADPHAAGAAAPRRAALVWCVESGDDPVAELDGTQRIAVLNTLLPRAAGRIVGITHLKRFPLGLSAERTLVDGRSVRIGNAAQTLHPVAGQGLNLGLRDAHALVDALSRLRGGDIDALLRRVDWQRAPDRWAMIAATDFLARSFTWKLPGLGLARGAGLAALQALGPARSLLARQMMFGRR